MSDRATPSLLGKDTQTGTSVLINQEQRLKGLYVIGKTGSGKTTLLVNMILQDIEAGRGLCFFDTHGDAITDILRRLPPEREQDVILLDLLDKEYVFGLNVFQCSNPHDREEVSRLTSQILSIFEKLFYEGRDMFSEAPTLVETLENLIPVFLLNNMSLAEVRLFLDEEIVRKKLLASVTNPIILHFWRNFDRLKKDEQYKQVESTKRRINRFLTDLLALDIFGQREATIHLRDFMDEQKIILVKLSRQHEMLTALVGSILVTLIANAAYSRVDTPEDLRIPFYLYADEYQRFSTPTFAELLAEVRKYKIATCVAHQFRNQLDRANRGATLNVANLMVYQVLGEDAKELAMSFKRRPYPITSTRLEEIRTPVSDVLGHLKNRGGHRNPRVTMFINQYNLLDAPEYDFLFSRANRGISFCKLIQTEEEKTRLFTLVREHLYNAVKDQLFIPLSVFRSSYTLFEHYTKAMLGEQTKEDSEYYRKAQFYPFIYYYFCFDRNAARANLEIDRDLLTGKGYAWEYHQEKYDLQKDPTRELLFDLFCKADDPEGNEFWRARNALAEFINSLLSPLRQYNNEVVLKRIESQLYDFASYWGKMDWHEQREAVKEFEQNFPFLRNVDAALTQAMKGISRLDRSFWVDTEKCASLVQWEINDIIGQQQKMVERFFIDLRDVLDILSNEPIISGSGAFEEKPIELSSAEIADRIADKLTNPDVAYSAWGKIGTQEHIIQALPYLPADPDTVWLARRERVVKQTRLRYCKKRDDVDEEIFQRHAELTRRQLPTARTTSDDDEE